MGDSISIDMNLGLKKKRFRVNYCLPISINAVELSAKELMLLSYLQHKVDTSNKEYHSNPYGMFLNIPYKKLQDLVGVHYNKVKQSLIDKGIIEEYKNEEGGGGYSAGSFSKAFRLCREHWDNSISQDVEGIIELKNYVRNNTKGSDSHTDEYLAKTHDNLNLIEINPRMLEDQYFTLRLPSGVVWNIDHYLSQIASGKYTTNKIGKGSNRHYHPIICMNREARKHLFYKPNPQERLAYYDVKAAHPTFLGIMSQDKQWLEDLKLSEKRDENDVYRILFGDVIPEYDGKDKKRDKAKALFQQLISVRKTYTPEIKHATNILIEKYPTLNQYLKDIARLAFTSNDKELVREREENDCEKSTQIILQRLEAKIFVEVNKSLVMDGYFTFSLHDGCLFLDKDRDVILDRIKNRVEEVCGDRDCLELEHHYLNSKEVFSQIVENKQ